MASSKFIILSKNEEIHHTGFCALGHEIHLGRFILLDMLNKKCININDVIVTSNIERKFLYSKIFKNIISYNEYSKKNDISEQNKILIWPFVVSQRSEIEEYFIKDFESKCDYPIRDILYNKLNRNYDELLQMIDFPIIKDNNLVKKKFIVIHLRSLTRKSNNNIEENLKMLDIIIDKINQKYIDFNIIIFSTDKLLEFQEKNSKIKIINELDLYASLMNHENCECIISELSGGGEISQYCCNTTIHLYGNSYAGVETSSSKLKLLQEKNLLLHDCWNQHGTTDAVLNYYNNFNLMLENL